MLLVFVVFYYSEAIFIDLGSLGDYCIVGLMVGRLVLHQRL
jgi:hypothetical protein